MAARTDGLIDEPRFCAWLDNNVPEFGTGPLNFEVLKGGATNIVMSIDRGGAKMAMRRPPRAPRPDSEKVLLREARVQTALGSTDVPAPRIRAVCEDKSVIGVMFYVMNFVDGWCVSHDRPSPAPFNSPEQRRALSFALVDGIAKLAKVDYKAVGLEGFGKPENFLERQVDRWLGQHASYAESEGYGYRPLPGKDEVVAWLRANTPKSGPIGIIHGDYGFANAMFHKDLPARLAAMIDWELSTVGDPLLDLGWVLYGYKGRDDDRDPPTVFYSPDDPSREELADYYAEKTGRPVENLTYYMVLSQFKLAMLLERHYARGLNGKLPRETGEMMGRIVLDLLDSGARMVKRAG